MRLCKTKEARFLARAFSALGLSALLIVNGAPPVALAAPAPAFPGAHSTAGAARLLARAKFSRARTLFSLSPRLMQNGEDDIQVNDAARFLEQATFGPSFATDPADPNYPVSVAHVQELGFAAWINEQFNMPVLFPDIGSNYGNPGDPGTCNDPPGGLGGGVCWSLQNRPATCTNTGGSTCQRDNYTAYLLQAQFYFNALTGPDQLRQRVAWALSQIDVVSQLDIVPASWMTPYLQLFDRDAFGNFRQLLYDITVNPAMGEYLNMRGNTRQNVNENYAREILQLFSIGLDKLNPDGTPQLDEQGNRIPTYD